MIVRRKACVALVIAAILFLMIASQSIQRRYFLLQPAAPPRGHSTSSGRMTAEFTGPISGQAPPYLKPEQIPTEEEMVEEEIDEEEEEMVIQEQLMKNAKLCGCSDACISDNNGSKWFSQRYDAKQQPIIKETGNNFDSDALQWWLSLQRAGNDQSLEEVISKMFQVISPPSIDLEPVPSRCRSCAVVGNSGNLRHSGHGALIDSHGFVFRMNKAVTKGFEEDVGRRTTHHFLYPESAVDISNGTSLILLPFKLRDLEWLTSALSTGTVKMTYMRVKARVHADKDKVVVVNPVFFKYVHERWNEHHGRYPSTGMLAIVFALHVCDQVSVFGYGADKQGNWHHYWEKNQFAGAFKKTGVHSADFENQIIQHLANEGKITLHLNTTTSVQTELGTNDRLAHKLN
ncbi:ST3 beta-galactoside alpha-2,3-sialyltransferase 8 isoform X2 [Maylandia zebra]|uniref:CMP-N-acetylneuraminate-beta-galactosamide-alpha-2,3-sialyltransferase 2 n=1 Tax=Astatotilapia calliptera TaxID=8154 RepID=A0A3P8NLB9_ASTCA|nr:ST3 beta-galactoside alpha-2,3-sialyltransferase 8 isoform X2 [Haplochromis burtoni]XP_023010861.1 CMP-N-acetylneuraminate-beta-galactosamide-alpha-2,3-sialyltransferase 2 isoform X2 [Maylandia zebra]XP_026022985.1 CMP-N-acetylneuraminate-beta-galactosamide-alpha-2,3-sialyltransferase 2-like isoform X2 [Astatotilapia calliptera]